MTHIVSSVEEIAGARNSGVPIVEAVTQSAGYEPIGFFASQIFTYGARISFCVFLLLTSIYCLLAYVPFTYHWIVKGELLWWLPFFVKYHPCLYLAALGLVVPTMARDIHRERTRRLCARIYRVSNCRRRVDDS